MLPLDDYNLEADMSDFESCDKLVEEYEKKDSIKKWQFAYNSSICFSNNNPEINYQDDMISNVSIAPGEGKLPSNIRQEKDWDIYVKPQDLPDLYTRSMGFRCVKRMKDYGSDTTFYCHLHSLKVHS